MTRLQRTLRGYGYGIEETGSYDDATRDVVTAFQRHFRPARVDGIADAVHAADAARADGDAAGAAGIEADLTLLSLAAALTRRPRNPIPIPVSRPDGRSAPMPKGGRGGKSGLHGRTVPDNVRRGCPARGDLRDSATENRPPRLRSVLAAVRVKRCGKSAPRFRQRKRHGKPHREQDRIGMTLGRKPQVRPGQSFG